MELLLFTVAAKLGKTVGELRHSMSQTELLKWSTFLRWEQGEADQSEMLSQLKSITNGGPS